MSLYKASQAGDLVEMARLLDGGAELNALFAARSASGTAFQGTALGVAAAGGQLEAVRLLLDRGADPSQANSDGGTPLIAAVKMEHMAVVWELVARGVDVNTPHPSNGGTVFHEACARNQPECVAALVELGCDMTIRTKGGWTGKQLAEDRGHAVVLDVLRAGVAARLRAGTPVDQPAVAGATVGAGAATAGALYTASQIGDLAEMVRLLEAGAEPNASVAAHNSRGAIVQTTALHSAAGAGQLEAVRLLLDRGADASLAGSSGRPTPLMDAAVNGHAAVVRELGARGADLDAAQPETGGTAFHFACAYNQPECAAALVELGCDTEIKATDGRTGKQRAALAVGG
jgi:ankyrin repeat domain-containing protein 17